jgi:hypothetical protein
MIVREGITAAGKDTSPSANAATMKAANLPTHALRLDPSWSNMEVSVVSDADAQTGTLEIWGQRFDGDLILIASITLVTGKAAATSGGLYVDTMVVTYYWPTEVKAIDNAGGDRQARVYFDTTGLKNAIFYLTAASAGTWGIKAAGIS